MRHFNELKDAGRQTTMLDEETESDDEVQRYEEQVVIDSENLDMIPTKQDIDCGVDKSEKVKESVLEEHNKQPKVRRSKRERRPPQRLQLDLGKTKRYSETGEECKVESSSSASEDQEEIKTVNQYSSSEALFDGGEEEYPSDC